MKDAIKYVGLDVHKEEIAVSIAEEGRGEPRYWGMIPHKVEDIRKLVKKLGDPAMLRVSDRGTVLAFGNARTSPCHLSK